MTPEFKSFFKTVANIRRVGRRLDRIAPVPFGERLIRCNNPKNHIVTSSSYKRINNEIATVSLDSTAKIPELICQPTISIILSFQIDYRG